MAIRLRPSDVSTRKQRACGACAEVRTDIIDGELQVQSLLARLPGKADWPLLGSTYRSQDAATGPFGTGRSAAGFLGMKVLGTNNTSPVNVVNEQGEFAYYEYLLSECYENKTGGRNSALAD